MKRLAALLMLSCATLAACGEPAPVATPEPAPAAPETASAPTADPAQGDGGVDAFYTPDASIPAEPGKLIRTMTQPPETSLAEAGQASRILYSSTNGLGDGKEPIAVSGSLFIPKGAAPAGGWPLIAWAHGTVGVADVCAPSNRPRSDRDTIYLNHWLSQGYAVVASDYQGLGTPGGHPYLATRPAAYSVLDSIRAVQGDPALNIGKPVVLVGQSQGGGAAFATAGEAATYAPELDIRGTVATGTPYFTADAAPAVRDPNAVSGVFAYSLYIMYLAEQADPTFRIADYVTPKAGPVIESTRTQCLFPGTWDLIESEGLNQANAFTKDPTPAIAKFFPLMAYSTLKVKGPVFMGTGGKDADVPPPGQTRLFNDACAAGSVIEHKIYPDLDHSGAVNGSLADSTPFVKKAFAGEAIAGNCPK
jgi:pimeloyl-ACP methyl ester carboxylesterase